MNISSYSDISDYIYANPGIQLSEQNLKELEDVLIDAHSDLAKLCKLLFPRRFRLEFTKAHYLLCELLDSNHPRIVVCAFRGFGKTSITTLGQGGRAILFRDKKFIPYVSKTATYSESQTDNLRRALVASPIVRALFGSMRVKRNRDMDESWSKKTWVASFEDGQTCVLPRSIEQQLRGLLFDDWRPDLYLIDDLEDDEQIDNESYRLKVKERFFGPLMESISQAQEDGVEPQIVYTDTIKHPDSLIVELLDSRHWEKLILPVCDDSYNSLVPDFIPTKFIKDKVEWYREMGKMDIFAREFMCTPTAKETAVFKPESFRYYEETDPSFCERLPYIRNVVLVDPARTTNITSAETGFVCWGIDVYTNALYLREATGMKLHIHQIYDKAFQMCKTYNAYILGVESHGLHEFIMQPFRDEMIRRGEHYELVDLKPRRGKSTGVKGEEGGKASRVGAMGSLYDRGVVFHNKTNCLRYETQLLAFPRPKLWDIIDVASYILQIQDEYAIYFTYDGKEKDEYEYDGEYDDMEDYKDKSENIAVNYFI